MSRATNAAVVLAGLAATFAILSRRTLAAGAVDGPLTVQNLRAFADSITRNFNIDVPVKRIVRIAWIESSNRATDPANVRFNPSAVRFEPSVNDASSGVMQTLVSTARWLATDMGYGAFGVPQLNDLLGPQASVYFGAAYLEYLSNYRRRARSEEWIVRSYNGGPGHGRASTDDYWRLYKKAKGIVG